MFVLFGEAEAGSDHASYEAGSLHSVVAVVRDRDLTEAATTVSEKLFSGGFVKFEVFDTTTSAVWRRILPTDVGQSIRRALFSGVAINVYSDDNRADPEARAYRDST